MSSPVRIDAQAWGDLRFATLARLLGLADRDHALIKVARIWSWQTEHYTPEAPTYVVDRDIVDSALGDGGVAALVRARLAEELPEGVRMKGTKDRIEWYWKLCQKSAKGGEATRARHATGRGVVGPGAGPQALKRSADHKSNTTPAGSPEAEPQAGPQACERTPDNTRGPAGPPQARPQVGPQPGPLTLPLSPDQGSEDLFLDGGEAETDPSTEPSGDHDREGAERLTFEQWQDRRRPRSAPSLVRTADSCKPGDAAAAIANIEQLRGTR